MYQNKKKCFVCENTFPVQERMFNIEVNLPVCSKCYGTEKEKTRVKEMLESLADGFICGCI